MSEATSSRVPALDGLRGIAVALVVAYHYWPDLVPGGFVGVSVFFTLSGFLIASLVRSEHESTGRVDLVAFYARRVRRLLPASLVTLVAVVGVMLVGEHPDASSVAGDAAAAGLYVANWRTAAAPGGYEALLETGVRPLDHFWSLSIEEQFYLVAPLLLVWPARRFAALTVIVGGLGLWFWWGDPDSYFATPVRAIEIALGVGLASVIGWPGRRLDPGSASTLLGVGGLVALGWMSLVWHETDPHLFRGSLVGVGFVSVALVLSCLGVGPVQRCLSSSGLVWLGKRSYAVYLFHWPLAELTSLPPLVAALVTMVLAEASWRLIERPALAGSGWTVPTIGLAVSSLVLAVGAIGITVSEGGTDPVRASEVFGEPAARSDASSSDDKSASGNGGHDDVAVVPVSSDESLDVLVVGDSQAVVIGTAWEEWAAVTGAMTVVQTGIRGCSGLLAEGWEFRYDNGESGQMRRPGDPACTPPPLEDLLVTHDPDLIVVAEWGTAMLDHRWAGDDTWVSTLDQAVADAWGVRYRRIEDLALANDVGLAFLTGPPCGRVAPCSEPGRIDAYNAVLEELRLPVLDLTPIFAAEPEKYRTDDGSHVSEGRPALLLAAEVIAPFAFDAADSTAKSGS